MVDLKRSSSNKGRCRVQLKQISAKMVLGDLFSERIEQLGAVALGGLLYRVQGLGYRGLGRLGCRALSKNGFDLQAWGVGFRA